MALTLHLANFSPANTLEQAQVKQDATKGVPSLLLDNTQGFAANDFILIGKKGSGKSSINQISGISDGTLTLVNGLADYYDRGAEVTKLFGDKLRVYRAAYVVGQTAGINDYALISGGTFSIDPDQLTTEVTDTTGSDQYWYKYTFYNSFTTAETSIKDSTAVRDTTASDYASIEDVRSEAGFTGNSNVTDDLIYRKLQAAQAKINGMLSGRYQLPLGQPVNPIISDLTIRLAAGYVMIAEYGTYDGQDKTKGEKLRDDALNELTAYQDGSQIITDLAAVSVQLPDAGGFESSYSSDNPLGFARSDLEGYNTRLY
jgi:phage gp36-like protein